MLDGLLVMNHDRRMPVRCDRVLLVALEQAVHGLPPTSIITAAYSCDGRKSMIMSFRSHGLGFGRPLQRKRFRTKGPAEGPHLVIDQTMNVEGVRGEDGVEFSAVLAAGQKRAALAILQRAGNDDVALPRILDQPVAVGAEFTSSMGRM